ncbi:ATP-dependent helicase [Candidatus Desantisbacteria bacterium]|nr:ATP-dependent helicase [Candidatus Desantisbacteria bacterium]
MPVYLDKLNPAQQIAVTHQDSPLLIIAGPGTGKTHTLLNRIVYLIENQNVLPESILALTFTRRAAHEMLKRLENILEKKLLKTGIFIGTIHAFGLELLLTEFLQKKNISFSIYTENDSIIILKEIVKNKGLKNINIRNLQKEISLMKNQIEETNKPDPLFMEIYNCYEEYLKKSHAMDFDDIIIKAVELLEDSSMLLKYKKRFSHILIDEFQDINHAQYKLIKSLALGEKNITAIGDPDQAIYAFRGANVEIFLQFKKDFPTYREAYLETNYRSSGTILKASCEVIEKSRLRIKKNIHTELDKGVNIEIMNFTSEKQEAEMIAKRIEQMIGGASFFSHDSGWSNNERCENKSFADFAILYRLQAEGNIFEEVFQRHGIPYQRVMTKSEKKSLQEKRAQYLLRIIQNSYDFAAEIELKDMGFQLTGQINLISEAYKKLNYTEITKDLFPSLSSSLVDEVVNLLFKIDIYKDAEDIEEDTYEKMAEKVTLITLHGAKGLEFPVVFIAGCEEGIIPYLKENEENELEEERRLFYVGMTRAIPACLYNLFISFKKKKKKIYFPLCR